MLRFQVEKSDFLLATKTKKPWSFWDSKASVVLSADWRMSTPALGPPMGKVIPKAGKGVTVAVHSWIMLCKTKLCKTILFP
jgi:hypothetical protein